MSGRAKRKTRAVALTEVTEEENANVLKVESNIPRSNGLNLSDSDDSSEDDTADDAKEKRLRLEKELERKRKTQNKKGRAASKKSKAAVGVQLASLASIVEEEENLWKKKDGDDDSGGGVDELQDVLESPRKKLDNDVAQLLKMGEAEKGGGGEDSDDSEADLVDAGQASSQGEDEDKKEAAQGEKTI